MLTLLITHSQLLFLNYFFIFFFLLSYIWGEKWGNALVLKLSERTALVRSSEGFIDFSSCVSMGLC